MVTKGTQADHVDHADADPDADQVIVHVHRDQQRHVDAHMPCGPRLLGTQFALTRRLMNRGVDAAGLPGADGAEWVAVLDRLQFGSSSSMNAEARL